MDPLLPTLDAEPARRASTTASDPLPLPGQLLLTVPRSPDSWACPRRPSTTAPSAASSPAWSALSPPASGEPTSTGITGARASVVRG